MPTTTPKVRRTPVAPAANHQMRRSVQPFGVRRGAHEYSALWSKGYVATWFDHHCQPRESQVFGTLAAAEAYRQDLLTQGLGATIRGE